jgi:hypothetical protein
VTSDPRKLRDLDPLKKSSDEAPPVADRTASDEPLQARGPDPREDAKPDDLFQEPHAKSVGGAHHDKTPPALEKQTRKHRPLEKGRWKDTGRAGA